MRLSVKSARAYVCDDMNRSGRKSARTAVVDVSLAVVSTSYASIVTDWAPFIASVSSLNFMYALSTLLIGRAVSAAGMNVSGTESNRRMTRVSRVSPRLASSRPGSVPSPERACTVVSMTTASMVMF